MLRVYGSFFEVAFNFFLRLRFTDFKCKVWSRGISQAPQIGGWFLKFWFHSKNGSCLYLMSKSFFFFTHQVAHNAGRMTRHTQRCKRSMRPLPTRSAALLTLLTWVVPLGAAPRPRSLQRPAWRKGLLFWSRLCISLVLWFISRCCFFNSSSFVWCYTVVIILWFQPQKIMLTFACRKWAIEKANYLHYES